MGGDGSDSSEWLKSCGVDIEYVSSFINSSPLDDGGDSDGVETIIDEAQSESDLAVAVVLEPTLFLHLLFRDLTGIEL